MVDQHETRGRRRGRERAAGTVRSTLPAQRPFAQPRLLYGPTTIATDDQIEAIHHASLRILDELGMKVLDDETRALFVDAGATADGQTVRFDPALVESLVTTAPVEFTLHARNQAHDLRIGGDHIAFG